MSKLSEAGIRSMDRAAAQRYVHERLVQVREILEECEQVMDVHRFIAEVPTLPKWERLKYLPRNLTDDERQPIYALESHNLTWCGIDERYKDGGQWLSSSTYGDCD